EPELLPFGQWPAPSPQAVQKSQLLRAEPVDVAQAELALLAPTPHATGMIDAAVLMLAGADGQADDTGPAEPAPLDKLVCLQARRRTLAVVRGAQHAEQ